MEQDYPSRQEMEPLGVIGPVYVEQMGDPHLRLNLQNPQDVFWNTLGQQNSPWHERVGELWGGSLLENTDMVWGGGLQEPCARTLVDHQPLCCRTYPHPEEPRAWLQGRGGLGWPCQRNLSLFCPSRQDLGGGRALTWFSGGAHGRYGVEPPHPKHRSLWTPTNPT